MPRSVITVAPWRARCARSGKSSSPAPSPARSTRPSMSPHLPITAEEIADAAIGAAEAGAAVVHLHARDPKTGQPDQSPEAFAPFLKVIKQRSNCVINITTGGAPTMTVEERLRPAAHLQAGGGLAQHGLDELRPLPDAGAAEGVQVRLGEALPRRARDDRIFKNTFADIEYILTTLRQERHPLRDRVLRHRPPLHAAPLRRPRRWSSRRSSSSRCSASSAASARTPRT